MLIFLPCAGLGLRELKAQSRKFNFYSKKFLKISPSKYLISLNITCEICYFLFKLHKIIKAITLKLFLQFIWDHFLKNFSYQAYEPRLPVVHNHLVTEIVAPSPTNKNCWVM